MFSLKKRRRRGDTIIDFKYLKECCTKEGQGLLFVFDRMARTTEMKQGSQFRLDLRKNFLIKSCLALEQELLEFSLMEVSKLK